MGTILDWLFDDDLVREVQRETEQQPPAPVVFRYRDGGERNRLDRPVFIQFRTKALEPTRVWSVWHRVTTYEIDPKEPLAPGAEPPGRHEFRTPCVRRIGAPPASVRVLWGLNVQDAATEIVVTREPHTNSSHTTTAHVVFDEKDIPAGDARCKLCFPDHAHPVLTPPPRKKRVRHGKKEKQPKEEDRAEGQAHLGEGSLPQGKPPEAKVKP